ncbi:MAG TPA: DNA alkylation repair protein [Propionibacteriaceae bacterium]|nr:DNA alkylation repair protein [Propionibacteriaceae bacterium]
MQQLVQAIAEVADPDTAAVLRRYFQVRPGGYGEGDTFLGVKLSTLRGLTAAYAGEPFVADCWLPLLRSPVHEHRLAALVVMAERARRSTLRRGDPTELQHIYETYLANTAYVNNWDLVDVSSKPIVGGHLQHHDRAPLYALARSTLIWDRRIAMVGSQWFLRAGETDDLFALAALLLDDRHDLMHKAVGWSLREAGKHDPAALRRFLDRHVDQMSRTTLRYAIEHFAEAERLSYLFSSKGGRPPSDPPRRANNTRARA